jgi:hypothetical protein
MCGCSGMALMMWTIICVAAMFMVFVYVHQAGEIGRGGKKELMDRVHVLMERARGHDVNVGNTNVPIAPIPVPISSVVTKPPPQQSPPTSSLRATQPPVIASKPSSSSLTDDNNMPLDKDSTEEVNHLLKQKPKGSFDMHFIHIPKCGGTSMTAILRQVACYVDPERNADCCLNPGFCDFNDHRRCQSIKGCINHFAQRYHSIWVKLYRY